MYICRVYIQDTLPRLSSVTAPLKSCENQRTVASVHAGEHTHLDGGEITGMFDDVVVVVQAQRSHVHGLVEGPRVVGVLLGEHVLDEAGAVAHLLLLLGAVRAGHGQHAEVVLRVGRLLLGQLGGPHTRVPRQRLARLGLGGRGLAELVVRRRRRRIGFPLLAFPLLQRSMGIKR